MRSSSSDYKNAVVIPEMRSDDQAGDGSLYSGTNLFDQTRRSQASIIF